jgi:hypothetical protein
LPSYPNQKTSKPPGFSLWKGRGEFFSKGRSYIYTKPHSRMKGEKWNENSESDPAR